MKQLPPGLQTFAKWFCRITGMLIILVLLASLPALYKADKTIAKKHGWHFALVEAWHELPGLVIGFAFFFLIGLGLVYLGWRKKKGKEKQLVTEIASPSPSSAPMTLVVVPYAKSSKGRWSSCNILQIAADAKRLWQFDAKGKGFVLGREQRIAHADPLPSRGIAKSWSSLWQPKLNVAWLPPENVFLRVIELPKSNFDETVAMVELQLEKLSPMPVAQIVWTMQILPQSPDLPRQSETAAGELQTVIVVIAERRVVEEFLGKLEGENFLADRLEAQFLDQLEADGSSQKNETAGAWIYPLSLGGQNAALVAWWCAGVLRNLSFVVLPPTGDRAANLKNQLAQLTWSGEMEGWLTAAPKWHLVADAASVAEWEKSLREGLSEPVQISAPLPAAELAGRTARRAALAAGRVNLLPPEFSARYHQQFVDRLWLRGLVAVGIFYAVCVAVYFCAVAVLSVQTGKVENSVATISNDYTNSLQLKARYEVLQEREDLKYAALDCWKLVAEQLPPNVTLQRFSFADGEKLSLSGTTAPDEVNTLFDFNSAMQKAKLNDQPMFKSGGEIVNPRVNGNVETWSFSLDLQRTEAEPQ
jgi:hypothetical protein